jgi:predicted nucleic acid-binding protein
LILVDTSIWIDHLGAGDPALSPLLDARRILIHPFVIGELALGRLMPRDVVLASLNQPRQTTIATHAETLYFIGQQGLTGSGIGYVDAHLLASTQLTSDAKLMTRDKRLAAVAERLALYAE